MLDNYSSKFRINLFMRNFTRNLTIGAISLALIATVMIVDVRLQTAAADTVATQPDTNELPQPTFGISVPLFESTEAVETVPTQISATTFGFHAHASSQTQTLTSRSSTSRSSTNPGKPVRLLIPSIGLDAPVEHLGKNAKGEMDVPSGETDNVGWYRNGTVPGTYGSAVIAAHVFAAFSELQDLAPGSDVYIITDKNERLHFVVEDAKEYALEQVSAQHLFNRRDAKRLNLITCAGRFIPSIDTYNRRLIVYTKLVD